MPIRDPRVLCHLTGGSKGKLGSVGKKKENGHSLDGVIKNILYLLKMEETCSRNLERSENRRIAPSKDLEYLPQTQPPRLLLAHI